jgi:predicted MFS family arabinose efflux permease
MFLAAAICIGLTSVAVQMLVPFAANLAPDASRGQVVGNVMSGLVLGILLSRPLASMISDFSSWRVVFLVSAGAMALVAGLLRVALPEAKIGAALWGVAVLHAETAVHHAGFA